MANGETVYQKTLNFFRRSGGPIKGVSGEDEAIQSIIRERDSSQQTERDKALAKIDSDRKILDNTLLNNTITNISTCIFITASLVVGGAMLAHENEKNKEIGKSIFLTSIGVATLKSGSRSLRSFLNFFSSSSDSEKN